VGSTGLVEALGLDSRELVSIVGGGGKSSLMFALGRSLAGRVVMTTTTRIFAAQMSLAPEVCRLDDPGWCERLDAFSSSLLVVGSVAGEHALGVPRELPAEMLERPGVDWVVVEADGSRMLPVKAPAAHEPVVPEETGLLVPVAGIDALSAPIGEVAHRPERVGAITGLAPHETLTPAALATLLTSREGGLKDLPGRARAIVLLNKVESPAQREAAREVARWALREPRVERVAIGGLREGLSSAWEVLDPPSVRG
jgi:molybdenum cofactor cytidylyltransferase